MGPVLAKNRMIYWKDGCVTILFLIFMKIKCRIQNDESDLIRIKSGIITLIKKLTRKLVVDRNIYNGKADTPEGIEATKCKCWIGGDGLIEIVPKRNSLRKACNSCH